MYRHIDVAEIHSVSEMELQNVPIFPRSPQLAWCTGSAQWGCASSRFCSGRLSSSASLWSLNLSLLFHHTHTHTHTHKTDSYAYYAAIERESCEEKTFSKVLQTGCKKFFFYCS